MYVLIALFIIILIIAYKSIKIVNQSEIYIIERLGKFHKIANAGITIIVPFIDKVRAVVSLKQQTIDIVPQAVITKDNATITIDTVVFFKITDPIKAVYEIQNLKKGIEYIAITTIRDIVGKMDLDDTFSSRDNINERLRMVLDEVTDRWGCKIERVEIKDIIPPSDIRNSMEKQMNAERNKRATILQAQGEKEATITLAEGKKQVTILNAETSQKVSIIKSEGEAISIKTIAQARAEEISKVYKAIKDAEPTEEIVQLKALEVLKPICENKNNTIYIPYATAVDSLRR